MSRFDKVMIAVISLTFILFVGFTVITTHAIVSHLHDIASGGGSLAGDFIKAAKSK